MNNMKRIIFILYIFLLGSCSDRQAPNEEVCLNGDEWTFTPVSIPFYGYELDAAGRWQSPKRSHRFIVDAINDPKNDWGGKAVRVPMSWSSVVSDPGEKDARGDFDFPWFWQYVHKGEYKRTFDIPESYEGKRIQLRFTSVNFVCWVYVNDILIKAEGEEKPYTHMNKLPFTIDITDAVKGPSKNNTLKIVVHDFSYALKGDFPNEDNPVGGIDYPLGDRCDYYNKDRGWRNIDNGIIGDVILKSVPAVNVASVFIKTDVRESTITANITFRNQSAETATLDAGGYVSDWKGSKKEFEFSIRQPLTLLAGEEKTVTFKEKWVEPELWWPYDPHLYVLHVTAGKNTVHRERFGFRQVETKQSEDPDIRGFYLNGIRVRLMGESMEPTWRDGYSEGVSGTMTLFNPEYWSYVIDLSKELNINTLRTHRGMSLERQFEIADEKGMMMIAESTINNGNHQGGYGSIENQRKAIRDLVTTHRNHPSIVFWSLANETPYQKEWEEEALKYDNTRPLTATQLVPRYLPGNAISTAACSYSMGLSGYDNDIYHRHDKFWKDKLLYVYEDNACYDEPLMYDRITTVQKGLSIFRGHRTTGYEMIFTFYTWQKLFGQPVDDKGKHMKLEWKQEEIQNCGYRPDYALMPHLDPWSDPGNPKIIRPVTGMKDNPMDFWKRTFSPVAVFDYEYDRRTDISASANPYVAAFSDRRTLSVHNDDILDTTKTVYVKWSVLKFDSDSILSEGDFSVDVPLGGVRQHEIQIDSKEEQEVRIRYQAFKSGEKRFEEIVYLSMDAGSNGSLIQPEKMTDPVLVIQPTSKSILQRGFSIQQEAGTVSGNVLVNETPRIGDYVQFNPWITVPGDYDLLLHIPEQYYGVQKVSIQHDTHNTEIPLDFSHKGWVKLNAEPLRMQTGKLENSIKIIVSDSSDEVRVGALKIVQR